MTVYPQLSNNDSKLRAALPMLSEDTIPSVKGEWYNYRSMFTPTRPLGYLMKCKANKDRTLTFVEQNPDVDLVFVFSSLGVQICSPDSRPSLALFENIDVNTNLLKRTAISKVAITSEQFNSIRDRKDHEGLISACHNNMVVNHLTVIGGMIIAVTTPAGKYCLMRAIEVCPKAVCFDACHVLI